MTKQKHQRQGRCQNQTKIGVNNTVVAVVPSIPSDLLALTTETTENTQLMTEADAAVPVADTDDVNPRRRCRRRTGCGSSCLRNAGGSSGCSGGGIY